MANSARQLRLWGGLVAEIEIRIEVANIDAALAEIERRLENTAPVMGRIEGVMLDAVEQNFEEEGRPRWRGLAESTIRDRERKGSWPGKILQRSGRLATSVVSDSGNGYATVGSNLEYAAIHNFGGKIRQFAQTRFVNFRIDKRGRSRFSTRKNANLSQAVEYGDRTINIPARPFLALTPEDESEILFEIGDYLTSNL